MGFLLAFLPGGAFLGGFLKAAKGFLKVVWEALSIQVKIPIGIILVLGIVVFVWNRHAVDKAITDLVAGAELRSQAAIINNQKQIIDNKDALLDEKNEIIERDKTALEEFRVAKEQAEVALTQARRNLDALAKSENGSKPATADFFDRLLNK